MAAYPSDRSFVQAVMDAVVRAGSTPVDMQYFAAREGRPADYCRRRVRECDVYMAVIGFRYGSLVPGERMSYTELEFVEATAAGLPRLVFLLDETANVPAAMVDADRTAVDRFRRRVYHADLIVAEFRSAEGLELAVFQALTTLGGADRRLVPHQLPAAVMHFAGRSAELATLTALLDEPAEAAGTVVISAIEGTAGVGKTALAVHWAHQVADRFPDGQLYVNLRGFDPSGSPMQPAEAVLMMLDAFGVPPQRLPVTLEAQSALYRTVLAERRVLVLLDNARDEEQVRPLVPGSQGCLVLVTSRKDLTGLVATEGAHPVVVDLLSEAEARTLLARRLGGARVAAEPEAVEDILASCARLPLAVAIVAARAATRPRLPLGALAAELHEARGRLDPFVSGDATRDVRAVFSWSYAGLGEAAARLFRMLAIHPGPYIGARAAASLIDATLSVVRPALAQLTRDHLLTEVLPRRYTFHDLLRAYATELALGIDDDADRAAATDRMLDYYVQTASRADRLLNPGRDPLPVQAPSSPLATDALDDPANAIAWFTAEHRVLLGALERAVERGDDLHAYQLAWSMATFLDSRGHWQDAVTAQSVALDAARRMGDRRAEAYAHHDLARACTRQLRAAEATRHFSRALELFQSLADQAGQAHTHRSLAWAMDQQGNHAAALGETQQALALFRVAGDQAGLAKSLNAVGWFHAQLGMPEKAVPYCEEALLLHQKIGNRQGEAHTWDSLGLAHSLLGEHNRSLECYDRAVALWRQLEDRYDEAATLDRLGRARLAAGDAEGAQDAWARAALILDDLGLPKGAQVRSRIPAAQPIPEGTELGLRAEGP